MNMNRKEFIKKGVGALAGGLILSQIDIKEVKANSGCSLCTSLTHYIDETCISCGICVDVCSDQAIWEGEARNHINDNCTDCGDCIAECPLDAIHRL